jgi:hypothetical protein
MAHLNASEIVKTTKPAQPQIYAYSTPEIHRHDGWTKIGYTEQNVRKRIEQQTHTANVRWHLEWQGNATWEDGSGTFKDTDFHGYLQRLNIPREANTEWFEIDGQTSHQYFYEFRDNHGWVEIPAAIPYTLRDEQRRFVDDTVAYKNDHDNAEVLWNAKPRFGKTLTAYDLCQKLGAKKVLIVTNRPAIADSWYEDYEKFMGRESGWVFISSVSTIADKPHVMSRREYVKYLEDMTAGKKDAPKGFVEFVSLQDLKGSIHFGGIYHKLDEVAELEWDVLIIDEAHEGVDTLKTDVAFDHIKRHFTLHLSGTPFKAIANEKFPKGAVFNWTYADEQRAKENWPKDSENPNPYANLPKLNLLTYQMSAIVEDKVRSGIDINGEDIEYAFDLNEFFATDDRGYFVHNDDVDRFLNALTTQERFPFSTPELRDKLRHTFWLLSRVDSARALARKLKKHPVFKDYEVVLAAGDGRIDDDDANEDSLKKVRDAIATHDKTITLSVGQLTTGVTVPEWTAVLMLCNLKSPALYMQAAFRCQNPCLFARDGKFFRKENAYVFDFDPARTLTIFEEFANDLYSDTASGGGDTDKRKQNVRTLLNFFPVYGEDEDGEMVQLDAERVLSIPRRIRSREVVRRGFMSDFLFQNISNVFHAPSEIIDVINGLKPYKEQQPKGVDIDDETAEELFLNEDGNVAVPEERIVGTATDLFGDKVYGNIADDLDEVIDSIDLSKGGESEEDKFLDSLREKFATGISNPLVERAKESYGENLGTARQKKVERRIRVDVDIEVNKRVEDFKIQRNIIEAERKRKLDEAETSEEANAADAEANLKLIQAKNDLVNKLRDSREQLVHGAGETIVREVETARREKKKSDIEGEVRDHLRGFSRTIPSFLMAYGDDNTTLENFDKIIPANVFKDVTSITVDQFRFLRDGGDFVSEETGATEHFDGHLFDAVVFDDSVKEFIRLRGELANYFDDEQDGDIFDYVPPQKTNQIFTPKKVVKDMVNMREEENPGCFDDPTHTFADLYMKSGLYIAEIVKRLYNSDGMKRAIPDDDKRLRHILEKQVFGVAPTEIIYQISTHFILGYNDEIGRGCDHNFRCKDTAELAKEGKLAEWVESEFGEKL